jgi:hypothetical protein
MRRVNLVFCLLLGLVTAACESPKPRLDPDLPADDAAVGRADARAGDDAAPPRRDATPSDAASPGDDAAPPPPLDAGLDVDRGAPPADLGLPSDARAVDAAASDGAPFDAAPVDATPIDVDGTVGVDGTPPPDPDAAADDDAAPALDADIDGGDLGVPGPPRAFVIGVTTTAEPGDRVTVFAGDLATEPDADDTFSLGPLPPGPATLRFEARGYQTELVTVDVPAEGRVALDEPVILYRGRRLGPDHPDRLRFRFDEAWLAWDAGDVLSATPLPAPDPRVLVPRDYEVFLGWSLQAEAVHVRRRTVPGLAGDLDRVALDPVGRTPLFVEAQPWIIEIGERAVSMVHTRDALSRLESVVPGQAPTVLAEGVPWLLVQRMADDRLAWAQGDPGGFDIFVGPLDGGPADQVSDPRSPASDALLTTTPGRQGLLWLGVDGALWRYAPERGAERLADDVLAAPRPGFLPDGRVTFWRADVDGTHALHVYDDAEGEWRLVGQADGFSFRAVGDVYYLTRPGRSIWRGAFDGGGEDVLLGAPGGFVVLGDALLALIDGAAWRYRPQLGAEALDVEGLSGLRSASGGAVAWEEGELGDRLWYLPLLGGEAAAPLLEAAANRAIVSEPGGGALYVRDADSAWRRLAVPPDGGEDVAFAADVEQLFTVSAEQVLGLDAEGGLFTIDPRTGAARAWAFGVDVVQPSGRGSYVAYVCDRGLFLVDQR